MRRRGVRKGKMFRLYILICVDAINRVKKHNPDGWKLPLWGYLSAWLGIFLFSLLIILGQFSYPFKILLQLSKWQAAMLILVPTGILHYFLLFYRDNYCHLVGKYETQNKNYVIRYLIFVLLFFISSLLCVIFI